MDQALVYKWTKRDKYNGECWQKEEMSEQEKFTTTSQTVEKFKVSQAKFAMILS